MKGNRVCRISGRLLRISIDLWQREVEGKGDGGGHMLGVNLLDYW